MQGWALAWFVTYLAGLIPLWFLIMRIWVRNMADHTPEKWDELLVIGATSLFVAALWPVVVPVLIFVILVDKIRT